MVGVILPDCGGPWVPDTGGGEGGGSLPDAVLNQLSDNGQQGIVISGLVAWMEVQMDTEGCEVWRSLAERNWLEGEVTQAKEALKSACGHLLETLVPEFKTNRQKLSLAIEDIRKAIVALKANNSMPLVLASSGMMGRCPPAWGQPATSTTQDVMGKVHMLEEVMTSHMELQRKQMEKLSLEIAAVRGTGAIPKLPTLGPRVSVDLTDTPSKKRKIDEARSGQPSYAGAAAAVNGVQPIAGPGGSAQNSLKMLQQVFQQQVKPLKGTRSPRNICYGSAKTSGDQNVETMLAADVDLVASGVGKDCTDEDMSQFLKGRGIEAVAVETLTKKEVLDQVRTKTFKITVKAAQYEAALKPEVWPYRVAVRHYKAPRRQDTNWSGQAERSGGIIEKNDQRQQRQPRQGSGQYQRQLPVGHPQQKPGYHQTMAQQTLPDPVLLRNFFGLLDQFGSQEIPAH